MQPVISVQNIAARFGGTTLFEGVSFIINERDRIGLVGRNGAGKSTLLRILGNLHRPDEGNLVIPEGFSVAYLPQEMALHSTKTVFEEALAAFSEVLFLKDKIAAAEAGMSQRTDFSSRGYRQLLREHHEAYERLRLIGEETVQADTERTLAGLGFEPADFNRSLVQFSSGWKMRVELARILLQRPGLIMLDEPTNHLDIESIQWLEEFLTGYPGAVILVSHDRAFLDRVTTRTIEITLGKIYDYKAGYSGYMEQREERMETQLAAYSNQQRQIRQIERFIERFRYKNTKARQVQSRIRMLEKLDPVEVDLIDESGIRFSFPHAPNSGKIVVEARKLSKSYPQKEVLKGLDFQVIRGDRIAFVGRNGEGKTTLARILAGQTDHNGELRFGHQVVLGYYAQDQADILDPEKTVFRTIDDIALGDIRPKIRTILGSFQFSGDDIEKKVKVLSGGEKSRLSLAKLLLTPYNLMILDEPTNHLDMRSKDILKNAILQFTGTLIIVSHDRDFLQGLTGRVFEFRNGGIREYIGDIYDFLEQRKLRSLSQLESPSQPDRHRITVPAVSERKAAWQEKKSYERELRLIRTKISRCEQDIETLETRIRKTEEIMGNPEQYPEPVSDSRFFHEYEELKKQLEDRMEQWQALLEQLDVMLRGG